MKVARRFILDIEMEEDEDEQFFDFLCEAAHAVALGWGDVANFELSAGPAPADACFPYPLVKP
jgi:hypothetical protein